MIADNPDTFQIIRTLFRLPGQKLNHPDTLLLDCPNDYLETMQTIFYIIRFLFRSSGCYLDYPNNF